MSDSALLDAYTRHVSQSASPAMATRHINPVYSVARPGEEASLVVCGLKGLKKLSDVG